MKNPNFTSDIDIVLWNISVNDDQKAFRSLFEMYYAPLCLYAKRYIDDKDVREDIVQDVFFTVWEKRKSIAFHTSHKQYLITSVKNHSLNYLRKQGYFQEYQNKLNAMPPEYAEHADMLYNLQELKDLLSKALAKLPEEHRIAFVMSRFENKSTQEIAEYLGLSTRTVERYRKQAIKLLQEELKDYLPMYLIVALLF